MVFWPGEHVVYRPAHAHANLLGFVSMFIFGVAYHVLPRFVGRPLAAERWAMPHLWIQNAGLAAMVVGWLARPTWCRDTWLDPDEPPTSRRSTRRDASASAISVRPTSRRPR